MADNTDFERLIIEFQANTAAVQRSLVQFTRDVDNRTRTIERTVERMNRRVQSSFNQAARGFRNLSTAVVSGAAFFGISRFVSAVVSTATKIQDTADALGVSTTALQSYGIQAGRAGVNQEQLNTSLSFFAKALGAAKDGTGPLARELAKLGINPEGPLEEVLLRAADAMARMKDPADKAALAVKLFGRAGVQMVPFLQQGRAAIAATTQELIKNGSIITEKNLAAIDDLDDKWADLQRRFIAIGGNVLAGFTDEFSRLADELGSDELLQDMQNFGESLAQIAAVIVKLAPILPNLITAFAGLRIGAAFGPIGAAIGGVLGFLAPEFLDQQVTDLERIKGLMADIADAQALLRTSVDRGASTEEIQRINDEIVAKIVEIEAIQKRIDAIAATQRPAEAPPPPPPGPVAGAEDDQTIAKSVDDLEEARARFLEAKNEAEQALTKNVEERFRLERARIGESTLQALAATERKKNAELERLQKEVDEGKLSAQALAKAKKNIEEQFTLDQQTILERQTADIQRVYDDELQRAINLKTRLADLAAESAEETRQARQERIRAETELIIQSAQGTPDEFAVNQQARRKMIDEQEADEIAAVQARLEARQRALDAEIALLKQEEEAHQAQLDAKVAAEQAAQDEIAAIRADAQRQRIQQAQQENELLLSQASDFFGNLATLSRSGNATLAAIGKAAAIAQATIDGILAVQKALASAPPPFNFALAATVGIATAANIAQIAAMEKGGIVGPGGPVPLKRYARGGVASSPQLALFGEGAANEAFVPLPDGRRIPVSLDVSDLPESNSSRALTQVFEVDARGAQEGVAEQIAGQLRILGPQIAAATARQLGRDLPDMLVRVRKAKL